MIQNNSACDIGFIGLGVMGKNLVLNLADNGFSIAAFDLDISKVEDAITQDKAESGLSTARVIGCSSYTELLSRLKPPHLIVLSVPAGAPVDQVCESLMTLLLIQVIAYGLIPLHARKNTKITLFYFLQLFQVAKWGRVLVQH
jgi:6-phosphogluconate dehydrogenase